MPRPWGERLTAIVFIVISIYVGVDALEFPAGGGTFPIFSAVCAVLLSLGMIARSFYAPDGAAGERVAFSLSFETLKPVLMTALVIVYVLAIFQLGYFTSTFLFLVIATLLVGIRNYRAIALTAVILFPLMYLFFVKFLQAQLPEGVLI